MITEDYVDFSTAKLLKEKGFKEWCSCAYGISVRHNGEEIDEDEEYELKSEGKGNEIEYVEGGTLYGMNYDNSKDFASLYACPTQAMAMKWLREVHGLFISIGNDDLNWCWQILDINHRDENLDPKVMSDSYGCNDSYEEAVSNGLVYCLENLI